jgi:glycosyltransferase involved in cell wall biosynthesis
MYNINNMSELKIATFGYRGPLSLYPALDHEFVRLGHKIVTNEEPNFMFDCCGTYENILEHSKKYPKAKKIFNTLSADVRNPNWPFVKMREQLLQADLVTSVSQCTANDIKERTGVECKEITYWPIKDVKHLNYHKTLDFLFVGRLYNWEKRFSLIPEVLKLINYDVKHLMVVGSERPPVGRYIGLVSEDDLNEIYNSTRYVFCPVWREGAMSMLEACVAGAFPIVCNDNSWVSEFGLDDFASNPIPLDLAKKIMEIEANKTKYTKILDELRPQIIEKFGLTNFANRLIRLYENL